MRFSSLVGPAGRINSFAFVLVAFVGATIARDLVGIAPSLLALPHDEATRMCERIIRAYDPCISCATHFLRLDIEHPDGASPDSAR